VFQTPALVVLRDPEGGFEKPAEVPDAWSPTSDESEMIRACLTDTPSRAKSLAEGMGGRTLCMPLLVSGRAEGVLALRIPRERHLDAGHRELLDAFASQMGIALEIQKLATHRRDAHLLAESARLQKTLFDSVSHELKTPIAAIRVALEQPVISGEEIRNATDRLHRAVEQLLNATRIESGLLRPILEWCDPAELAQEAIALASGDKKVRLTTVDPLPLVEVDGGLVVQSLVTLLENALTHGASEEATTLLVSADADFVTFDVSDKGRGIPPGYEARLFEKFYRLPGCHPGGVGLGLAIAKQFIEALGGHLQARNREGGGASFSLTLPVSGNVQ
jgi:two-component system sensor histidine kinase KdpD